MSWDPAGQRVLVTGASSGIGAALAVELGRGGAYVGLAARRGDRLEQVLGQVRDAGGDGCWWTLDLADLDSVAPFADRAWAEMGPIDVLVNNAGAPRRRSMKRLTPAELDETMAVNFTGSARLSLALLPYMLERDSGAIVNVSSMGTQSMAFRTGAYGAAKAALNLFTEGLYFDLAGTGVRAHLFTPGSTDTEFSTPKPGNDDPFPQPSDAFMDPVDVANALIAKLGNDDFEGFASPALKETAQAKRADPNAYLVEALQLMGLRTR
ncbi:MAG: SDR family oxidoreductase [Acidimicrobiia bacterium]|nr:SDR family oxidoreductase [Acidimicrobiia bacterium]MYE74379.1 SDR family oxidoreductase [Acidimicrobiia bacterium]MYJ62085.1 SDR family oxidoreductase [Acidimicrobiia bacterium]